MVLLGRIELPTSALPRMRSTTELQQPTISACPPTQGGERRRAIAGGLVVCQAGGMTDGPPKPTREDRLAAQLRANLRRRKEQARELRREESAPRDSSPQRPSPQRPSQSE